jgi:hypothetical protein
MTKRCFKCQRDLDIEEFYRHSQMADGHLGKCKECTCCDARINRALRVEKYRSYDRSRASLPHRVAARAQYARSSSGLATTKISNRLHAINNPDRAKARWATSNAIRDGRLLRGCCEVCGDERPEAHHDDYSNPLSVRWLCHSHHVQHHMSVAR